MHICTLQCMYNALPSPEKKKKKLVSNGLFFMSDAKHLDTNL